MHSPPLTSSATGQTDQTDALLRGFLAERDDRHAGRLFEELFRLHYRWLFRRITADPALGGEPEDLLQETRVRLWRVLERRRLEALHAVASSAGGDSEGVIRRFRAYLKAVVRSVIVDRGPRQESPEYANLFRQVRLLVGSSSPDSPFGLWIAGGAQLCGFQAWHDDTTRLAAYQNGRTPALSDEAQADLARFADRNLTTAERADLRKNLPLAVGLVFKWLNAPVRLAELVEWVAVLVGVAPARIMLESDLRDDAGNLPDNFGGATRSSPEDEVVGLAGLRAAIIALPPNSQLVLLCGLDGGIVGELLQRDRAVTVLAGVIEKTAADLKAVARDAADLLRRLAITDEQIALLLSTTVGNIHVIRNRAKKLLEKNLRSFSGDV